MPGVREGTGPAPDSGQTSRARGGIAQATTQGGSTSPSTDAGGGVGNTGADLDRYLRGK